MSPTPSNSAPRLPWPSPRETVLLPPGHALPEGEVHPYRAERVRVLRGALIVQVEGKLRHLGPGESTLIPAGAWHRAANLHPSEAAEVECEHAWGLGALLAELSWIRPMQRLQALMH
ncbi:MAG: cupin domain-containing protein [Alphaproteobacteria bacterium]|nr:cupin domain-containing protein [Alphaproteobacteria bacterium]